MSTVELEPLPDDWSRAMAVVAHPDDLEYGAASAVARWTTEGREVVYVLATSGEAGIDGLHPSTAGPLREEEERRGAAHVGVTTVEFLGYRDGVLEYGLALRRDIARAIRRHRPEVLLTINHHASFEGGGVNMADHRVVGDALIDAARDAENRWVFTELLDEGLEPWAGARRIFVAASPVGKHAVDVTGFVDAGIASLREHRAYLEGLPSGTVGTEPDGFLRGMAAQTGARFGGRPAVGFELIQL
ncbi:MAG: PIG-L deacetylase family protein [Acidimicrobiia bacterium]